MNKQKGFTIVELIVVIAIIAILAAIVMTNVTGFLNKGKDAAAKGNMQTIFTNGLIYYDGNGNSFEDFDATTSKGYTAPAAKIALDYSSTSTPAQYVKTVASDGSAFCVCILLKDPKLTSGTWCIDSTGFKGESSTACASRCAATASATTNAVCSD